MHRRRYQHFPQHCKLSLLSPQFFRARQRNLHLRVDVTVALFILLSPMQNPLHYRCKRRPCRLLWFTLQLPHHRHSLLVNTKNANLVRLNEQPTSQPALPLLFSAHTVARVQRHQSLYPLDPLRYNATFPLRLLSHLRHLQPYLQNHRSTLRRLLFPLHHRLNARISHSQFELISFSTLPIRSSSLSLLLCAMMTGFDWRTMPATPVSLPIRPGL